MTPGSPTLYVLDFDGVVCDGLDECLVTAWIAFRDLPVHKWNADRLSDVSADFRHHFRNARNFVRHDGHFLVPLMTHEPFRSAAAFEAFYSAIGPSLRDGFRNAFRSVRSHIRQRYYSDWIGMHTVHETMLTALRRMESVYIVSGKDAESILAILASRGVILPPDHIFGGQTSKVSALSQLKDRADANSQHIVFCDDNLTNTLEVRSAGIETFWARWGYHTAEDIAQAEQIGMPGIELDDVAALFVP